MATVTTGYSFSNSETNVTHTKLNNAVNNATVTAIVAADITDATITGAKIATGTVAESNLADLAVTNAKIAASTIDLTAKVTGFLPVANGGTGAATAAAAILALLPTATALQQFRKNSGNTAIEAFTPDSGLPALGGANLKLFTNAANNAAEWAAGMAVVWGTHDVSVTGDQAVTGVGFKPSAMIFFSAISGTNSASFGLWTSGQGGCALVANYGGASWGISGGPWYVIYMNESGGDGVAVVKSADADGFTLTWSKAAGSPTGTCAFNVLCFR